MKFYFVNSLVKFKKSDLLPYFNKLANSISADLLSTVRNGDYNSKLSASLTAAKALVDGLKSTEADYIYLAWKGSLLKTSAFFKNEPKVYSVSDLSLITVRNVTAVILCTETETAVHYGTFKPNDDHTGLIVESSPESSVAVYESLVAMDKLIAPMTMISEGRVVDTRERYQNTLDFMEKKAEEFTKGAAYVDVCSCGRIIKLTKNQLDWYKDRNFHMPKHCYFCKQAKASDGAETKEPDSKEPDSKA